MAYNIYSKAGTDEATAAAIEALNLGTAATTDADEYATAAQGAKADSAVQPGDLPAFGTAATTDSDEYATAAQGALADATTVEQVTLNANLDYTLPADTPANTVHRVTFTQDGTGGHTVTYGPDTLAIDTDPGASTLVEIWPSGTLVYPGASTPEGPSFGLAALLDNGDGTLTLSGSLVADNFDGTLTIGA